jgi:hypothetical protein
MRIGNDIFISSNSKRNADGSLIYYLHSIFGRGYKIPSVDLAFQLQSVAARSGLVAVPLFVPVAACVSLTSAIYGLIVSSLLLKLLSWRSYRNWTPVTEKLKYKDILGRGNERLLGTAIYMIWCISCVLFMLGAELLWSKLDNAYIPLVLVIVSIIGLIFTWRTLKPAR